MLSVAQRKPFMVKEVLSATNRSFRCISTFRERVPEMFITLAISGLELVNIIPSAFVGLAVKACLTLDCVRWCSMCVVFPLSI
jgi:hypothetical protein